jgi:hypothetical protein
MPFSRSGKYYSTYATRLCQTCREQTGQMCVSVRFDCERVELEEKSNHKEHRDEVMLFPWFRECCSLPPIRSPTNDRKPTNNKCHRPINFGLVVHPALWCMSWWECTLERRTVFELPIYSRSYGRIALCRTFGSRIGRQ